MERLIGEKLLEWKNKDGRKPLLVYGARQTGKTHSIMEFGTKYFASIAYCYFDSNAPLCDIFEQGFGSVDIIITRLQKHLLMEIDPKTTLIFFDEVQICPAALSSLKRFHETAPQYHIIAAGSLMGVALRREGYSFPVGKVDELYMYPLTFEEFLMEMGPGLAPIISGCYRNNEPMPRDLHEKALDLFLQYLVIGGMPEVILEYKKTNNYTMVMAKQLAICNNYIADMNKYTETKTQAIKNEAVYNTLPSQLGKENRKFQYSLIKSGARANDYEFTLHWLEKAAVVIKCNKVNEGKEPLASYENFLSFKVYMNDVGLYCAKSNNSHLSVIGRTMGDTAKGAITENYIAQQLRANGFKFYYWESNNQAELDFIIQIENQIIPIEAKSWESVRSQSLETFCKKYSIKKAIRISAKNFGFENGIKSVPLYAVWCIKNTLLIQ